MYAKKYYDTLNKMERMDMIDEIKENESSLFDDMKDIVKSYIKNNITINSLSIQKKKFPKIKSSQTFQERDLQMNYTCLLDLKNVEDNEFDKKYMQFIQQKQQLPEIQADILKNIKSFIESDEYVKGYYYIKEKYNLTEDKDIIHKMRQKIYSTIKND